MQIPQLSAMAIHESNIILFISLKLAHNQIGNKGCEYLSQSQWPFLKSISLG